MEIHKQQFLREINTKPKLRTYKLFKNTYESEPYVTRYLSRSSRSIFSQFRTGILPLRIETGRYNNVPLQDRLCVYCQEEEIEDEFHFLLECPLYTDMRQDLLSQCNQLEPNFQDFSKDSKLKLILGDERILSNAVHFVVNAYHKRKALPL